MQSPISNPQSPIVVPWLTAGLLTLAAFWLYFLPSLLWRPLVQTPEARIAVVAREMIQSHNYVLPTMGGKARLIKPPLPYWLTALVALPFQTVDSQTGKPVLPQRLMTRAVQFPSALCGALTVLLLILFGSHFFGRTAGLAAGLILGTAVLPVTYSQLGYCDTTLMFICAGLFCSAAWLLYAPRPTLTSALTFGLCLGLGVLTKWYIPLALVGLPLLAEGVRACLIRNPQSTIPNPQSPISNPQSLSLAPRLTLFVVGLVIAVMVAAPWFMFLEMQMPGANRRVLEDVIYATKALAHIPDYRWLFYFEKLATGFLPWTPILLLAWAVYWSAGFQPANESGQDGRAPRNVFRFFSLVFVLGFLAFYSQGKEQGYYLLPLFPPLALLSGYVLSRLNFLDERARAFMARGTLVFGVFVGAALLSFPLWMKWLPLDKPETADTRAFLLHVNWAVSVALGLMTAALLIYAARKFKQGQPLKVCALLAASACCGFLVWSWKSAQKAQRDTLYLQADNLKKQVKQAGETAVLYGVGYSEPLMIFYIEGPIRTLKELATEPLGQTGPNAPERLLLATPSSLCNRHLESIFKDYLNQPIFLARMPKEIDWPKELQEYKKKFHYEAGPWDDE